MSILTGSNVTSGLLWIFLLAMVTTEMQATRIEGRLNDASQSEGDLGESEDRSRTDYDGFGTSGSFADFPRHHHRHSKHQHVETPAEYNLAVRPYYQDMEIPAEHNLAVRPNYHHMEIPAEHNLVVRPKYQRLEAAADRNLVVRPKHLRLPMELPRPHHLSSHETFKTSPDAMTKSEMRELRVEEPTDGKPTMKLPSKFSYVAQQFYQYVWRNNAKKDEREGAEGEQNQSKENAKGGDNVENGKEEVPDPGVTTAAPTDEPVDPVILWRNIIGAPPSNCPPGQQKDMNGRCRTAIW